MEKFLRIEQKSDSDNPPEEKIPREESHKEAVEFVEKYRDFYDHYARGKVKFEPAPEGLDTFAFDLESDPPKIYLNSRFYKDRGLSEEKTSFATLHEIEHLLEKMEMLGEEGGEKTFGRYLKRVKESEAYSHMDNCVADVRENTAVAQKTTKNFR